jgi:uncharacterized protein YjgD (DUF1641 family)
MIQRGISGKVRRISEKVDRNLNKTQATHIENSVLKLMGTLYKIDSDTKDAYQKLNYEVGRCGQKTGQIKQSSQSFVCIPKDLKILKIS